MCFSSVVLFHHKIAACLFKKDFDHVGAVPVVINNQDASLFMGCRPHHTQASCGGILAVVPQFKDLSSPKLSEYSGHLIETHEPEEDFEEW